MTYLRVALDAELAHAHGPEIHWAMRVLWAGIGWAWKEVAPGEACDVAWVSDPASAPLARLCICASPAAWAAPSRPRLKRVGQWGDLAHPLFEGQHEHSDLCRREAGRLVCQRDLLFDVYWLVTGQEERYWPQDRHGFFDLSGTAMMREQMLRRALASQIIQWFEGTLLELGCPPPQPRWPEGKRAAAAAGHDVDYPEVKRLLEPLRILRRQGPRGLAPAFDVITGRRHHWQFGAWAELEKSLGVRSAFYFVPRRGSLMEYALGTPDPFYDVTAPRFKELLRALAAEGFEVGLHSSYLAYQSRAKFAAEKGRLEEAAGRAVVGNRHHYWHMNPADPEETLRLHEQIGFKYDSSLIHNHYLGWRRGLSQPFFPFHQAERRELKTLQIPLAWMDEQLFRHRADNPGDGDELLRALIDRAAEQGGCFAMDIHEYVFDQALFPGWMPAYRRAWEYVRARGDFWCATFRQIAEHWTARYEAIVQASCGLQQGRA